MKNFFHALVVLLVLVGTAEAQDALAPGARPALRSRPATERIEVDGRLDDAAWRAAVRIDLPFEVAPGDNVPAPVATECRIAHDVERLYVGCTARDPLPSALRAYVTERDVVAGQDRVEVTLVPFDDGRRGYRFVATAMGLQGDAQVLPEGGSGGRDDASWDAAWTSAGRIGSGGYVVEIAIPFSELRFPEGGDGWGIRIERHWPRETDVRLSSMVLDRDDACDLCQTARLGGLSDVVPGSALRLNPTITTTHASGVPATSGTDASFGADLLWVPAPAVAVGAAVNPDFSHVAADEARLDANERFALLYPERRALFLEGADLFWTPLRVFFSRSIADPDAAAKLTAKSGRTGVGVIVARDGRTNVLLPGREGSRLVAADGASHVAVLRLRRDVQRASSIGLLTTHRAGEDYWNHVGSVDALLRPAPSLTLQLQVAGSRTEDPRMLETDRQGGFGGLGASASVRHAARDWIVTGEGFWRTAGLRLDAGFEPQVGVAGIDGGVRRELLAGRDSWYQRLSIATGGFQVRRDDGGLLTRGLWFGGEYEGPNELGVRAYLNAPEQLSFGGRMFDIPTLFTSFSARLSPSLRIATHQTLGRAVDFSAAEAADLLEVQPRLEARVGRRIDLALVAPWHRLRREGETVLLARALEIRALYGIGARTSVRLVGQLGSAERPADGTRTRESLIQGLFAYQLDPQSVVRMGFARSDAEGTGPATLLFIKVGYAWRP